MLTLRVILLQYPQKQRCFSKVQIGKQVAMEQTCEIRNHGKVVDS